MKRVSLWRINTELLGTVSRGNTLLSSNKAKRPVGERDDGLMEREGERQAWVISALAALKLSSLSTVVGCTGDHRAWRRQFQRLGTMLAGILIDFLLINGSRNHPQRFILPPAYEQRLLTPVVKPIWWSWAVLLRKQKFGGIIVNIFAISLGFSKVSPI